MTTGTQTTWSRGRVKALIFLENIWPISLAECLALSNRKYSQPFFILTKGMSGALTWGAKSCLRTRKVFQPLFAHRERIQLSHREQLVMSSHFETSEKPQHSQFRIQHEISLVVFAGKTFLEFCLILSLNWLFSLSLTSSGGRACLQTRFFIYSPLRGLYPGWIAKCYV